MLNVGRLGKGETNMQKEKTGKTKNPLGDMKAMLPFLLGVTGGIASGKTTVVSLLLSYRYHDGFWLHSICDRL